MNAAWFHGCGKRPVSILGWLALILCVAFCISVVFVDDPAKADDSPAFG